MKNTIKIMLLLICFLQLSNIKAQANDSLTIGYSYINSFPQNSQVFINDSLIGYTPLYFIFNKDLNSGAGFIIRQRGYMDYVFKPESEEKINKTVSLIPLKKGMLLTNPVHEDKSQFFAKPRKVVPIVVTSILTAGAGILSYYFKKLANDNSDTFDVTGDQSALDRKKKYDIISGVSLGAFQVSFAGLLYFLFIDK